MVLHPFCARCIISHFIISYCGKAPDHLTRTQHFCIRTACGYFTVNNSALDTAFFYGPKLLGSCADYMMGCCTAVGGWGGANEALCSINWSGCCLITGASLGFFRKFGARVNCRHKMKPYVAWNYGVSTMSGVQKAQIHFPPQTIQLWQHDKLSQLHR